LALTQYKAAWISMRDLQATDPLQTIVVLKLTSHIPCLSYICMLTNHPYHTKSLAYPTRLVGIFPPKRRHLHNFFSTTRRNATHLRRKPVYTSHNNRNGSRTAPNKRYISPPHRAHITIRLPQPRQPKQPVTLPLRLHLFALTSLLFPARPGNCISVRRCRIEFYTTAI
jgi:hypothetical protein